MVFSAFKSYSDCNWCSCIISRVALTAGDSIYIKSTLVIHFHSNASSKTSKRLLPSMVLFIPAQMTIVWCTKGDISLEQIQ